MKPDWATRLQRTFARKYDAGFAKGLMLGKAVATRDEQERIVKLLEETEKHNYMLLGNNDGLERKHSFFCDLCKRIALIKGENK